MAVGSSGDAVRCRKTGRLQARDSLEIFDPIAATGNSEAFRCYYLRSVASMYMYFINYTIYFHTVILV